MTTLMAVSLYIIMSMDFAQLIKVWVSISRHIWLGPRHFVERLYGEFIISKSGLVPLCVPSVVCLFVYPENPRLCKVDLLNKIACFVKKKKIYSHYK